MVPMFVLTFLPAGLVGLIFVGILSALMSSLDSSINSLSAVSIQDLYRPYFRRNGSEKHYLRVSKVLTVLWGAFCILAAIGFASFGEATRQTTIVLINAIGSLLYGPILATFVVGMLTTRIGSSHIKKGILLGILANLALWWTTDISWLWWNLVGFLITALVAVVSATAWAKEGEPRLRSDFWQQVSEKFRGWTLSYSIVLAYFFLLLIVALLIESAGDF
jgi:SSS family solute:Na+ symporter